MLVLLVFALGIVLVMSNLPGLSLPGFQTLSLTKHVAYADLSVDIEYFKGYEISNAQSSSTPAPFQQWINMSLSGLGISSILRSDLGNIRFCTDAACDTMLNAWLEGCQPSCNQNATNINVWLKLPGGISAESNVTVFFTVFNSSTTFQSPYWGEAPKLSATTEIESPTVNSVGSNKVTSSDSVSCTVDVSNVGDLIYVQVLPAYAYPSGVDWYDTKGSTFYSDTESWMYVAWASANGTGSDTVTFSNSNTIPAITEYCYDVSGVQTTPTSSSPQADSSSASTTMTVPSFQTASVSGTAGFAAAFYGEFSSTSYSITAGSGFTQVTGSPIDDGYYLDSSEYSTSVTGSSQCPMSVSANSYWFGTCDSFAPQTYFVNYGEYDNGPSVFNFYNNFNGTTLSSADFSTSYVNTHTISVNNGLTLISVGAGGAHVFTKNNFTNNIFETYVSSVVASGDTYTGIGSVINNAHNTGSGSYNMAEGYYVVWGSYYPWYLIEQMNSGGVFNTYTDTTSGASANTGLMGIKWQTGSENLYYDYTSKLSWSSSTLSPGSSAIDLDTHAWSGTISTTFDYVRARAIPPSGVMPSVRQTDEGFEMIKSANNGGNIGAITNSFDWTQAPVVASCTYFVGGASCGDNYEIVMTVQTSAVGELDEGQVQAALFLNTNDNTVSIYLTTWQIEPGTCALEDYCEVSPYSMNETTPTGINPYTDCLSMSILSSGFVDGPYYQFTLTAYGNDGGPCGGDGSVVYSGDILNFTSDATLGGNIVSEGLSIVAAAGFTTFTKGSYNDVVAASAPWSDASTSISDQQFFVGGEPPVYVGGSGAGGGSNLFQSFATGVGSSTATLVGGVPSS